MSRRQLTSVCARARAFTGRTLRNAFAKILPKRRRNFSKNAKSPVWGMKTLGFCFWAPCPSAARQLLGEALQCVHPTWPCQAGQLQARSCREANKRPYSPGPMESYGDLWSPMARKWVGFHKWQLATHASSQFAQSSTSQVLPMETHNAAMRQAAITKT